MLRVENIPSELKKLKQWVCWDSQKIPRNPYTGKNAQSNNPETWSDFETAVQAVSKYRFLGVGFMFAPPYFGVDLDHCLDQNKQDFVDEFVETLQSYTEISQSGNGIHILCKGTLPSGQRRKGGVEMYQDGRYFAMTGNLYNPNYTEINECTESIKALHAKYLPSAAPRVAPKQIVSCTLEDREVIDKARNCRSGHIFQMLYSGNWEGLRPSQSEADKDLCKFLAFWTQRDEAQMDRIFRSSGLYRPKWDEKRGAYTYGQKTIQYAVTHCTNVYEPRPQQDDSQIMVALYNDEQEEVYVKAPLKVYDLTDTGNAQRICDKYRGEIKYSFVNKCWYYWTGKVWESDWNGYIKRLADTVIEDIKKEAFAEKDEEKQEALLKFANRTAASNRKEAMVKECQHLDDIPVLPDDMDKDDMLLNCSNGIVNLRNGEFIKHDSNYLQSKIAYAEYTESAEPPKLWLKFIDDVTGGDKDLARYLQKCVGYSLTGRNTEQCAFFLYGMGNNGKSTFLDTISELLGSYGANTQPETIMMRKNDSSSTSDIARLNGIRYVTCEEPSDGVRLNEGLLKQVTGGSKVTARFLYGNDFEFTPVFKMWLATNHKPTIRGTDTGIWRRIRLIPFEVCIPKDKVDKNLKYKLRKEFPQILRWAVEGCLMWQQEGLEPPEKVLKATAEYKNEMDILATFCEACLVVDNMPAHQIPANELFNVYQQWANKNNEYVMTSRKFFLEMAKKVPEKVRHSTGMQYRGVYFNDYGRTFIKAKGFNVEDLL